MITIDQLLESVDLDFEPGWVTKDEDDNICICDFHKPEPDDATWDLPIETNYDYFGKIKLAEFENKDWTECIYEVPRKTTGKIEKLDGEFKAVHFHELNAFCITGEAFGRLTSKINELVDAVNELKGAKNE